jgi:putative oxidoreductase
MSAAVRCVARIGSKAAVSAAAGERRRSNMDVLFLLGRIIFGGFWVYNGINHFTNRKFMAQYAASKGTPAPEAAVVFSGLLLLIGGALVILGAWPSVGLIMIIVFLLGVTPRMHDYWTVQDPNARTVEMINFSKNMALLGASVMLLMVPQPWPLSLALGVGRTVVGGLLP